MSALTWDAQGKRNYRVGVSKVVLYPDFENGYYTNGVAWNGVTAIDESPDGAEANAFYADNIKYANIRSAENNKGSISAYDFPNALHGLDGRQEIEPGLVLGQQPRDKRFGFCYRTEIGNDANAEAGYELHLVYNASLSPSEKSHETTNENPDLMEMDWDYECLPIKGYYRGNEVSTSSITVDSRQVEDISKLEAVLYEGETRVNTLRDSLYRPVTSGSVLSKIKQKNTEGTWTGNTYTVNGVTFTFYETSYGGIRRIGINGMPTDFTELTIYKRSESFTTGGGNAYRGFLERSVAAPALFLALEANGAQFGENEIHMHGSGTQYIGYSIGLTSGVNFSLDVTPHFEMLAVNELPPHLPLLSEIHGLINS